MSMGSLGESMWRMLRRVELHAKAKAGVPYLDLRTWSRLDGYHVAVLTELGLLKAVGPDLFVLTPAGVAAARFGEVEPRALSAAQTAVRNREKQNLTIARKAAARIRKARV